MRLTLAGEYAIRTMMYLAEFSFDRRAQISEISKACDIPESFLRNIVLKLSKHQLILSQRGAGGGVKLMRSPDTISLLDVVVAIEGEIALNRCLLPSQDFCKETSLCAVHAIWTQAQKSMVEELSNVTLQSLANINRERYEKFVQGSKETQ